MFVVDSCDSTRLDEARKALETALNHESLAGKPVLVLSNKCDMEGSMSSEVVSSELHLKEIKSRPVKLTSCSAKLNQNIEEGFRWVVTEAVRFRQLKNSAS